MDDKTQQALAGLIGGVAAGAVGGEGEIVRGQTIAQSATEFNRQLHEKEVKFIEEKAKEYAEQNHISQEEAQKILYLGAMYYNNKSTQTLIDKLVAFYSDTDENSHYTLQDIENAFLFLQQESQGMQFQSVESPYYQDNTLQGYFTSTQEQFENNSLTMPMQVGGMQDESYIFFPTTPILKTTTQAGTTIGKATVNVADDLYLKTSIKTENYLQNTVVPRVKEGYYGAVNYVYQPENVVKGITIVDTVYGAVSPEPPATGTQAIGAGVIKMYDLLENKKK